MGEKFVRTKENFTCGHCGARVAGNGYTNHCPRCLWSRHVDINPGDRAEACHGMMEPVGIESNRSERAVIFRCERCGAMRRCTSAENDSSEELIRLAERSGKNSER